jgi:hypothetical protein
MLYFIIVAFIACCREPHQHRRCLLISRFAGKFGKMIDTIKTNFLERYCTACPTLSLNLALNSFLSDSTRSAGTGVAVFSA